MEGVVRGTAIVVLLLLGGLFNSAKGSSSSQRDEVVSAGLMFELVRGQVEQFHADTLKAKDLHSASAGTISTTGLPVGRRMTTSDFLGVKTMLGSEMVPRQPINRRSLQESACADGSTSIHASSTVFPLMEGCFFAMAVNGKTEYATDTAVIAPRESSTSTDPPLWVAGYHDSADGFTVACLSAESADDVDPSKATWYCDIDGDGSVFTLANDELSVCCGCSLASPPSLATRALSSSTLAACGEGDSFSVVFDGFPDAEGCYLDTASFNHDIPIYTTSGTAETGQVWVFAVEATSGDTTTIIWGLVNMLSTTSSDANEVYCISEVEASVYHPSEVPVWQCDVDGDGVMETTGDALALSVDCGCPITSPSPTITSAPAPISTVPTCGDGDSFSIVSETLPDTEGCYLDSGAAANDVAVYTISGTSDLGQVAMVPAALAADGTSSAAIIVWALAFLASTDGSQGSITYCYSLVEAAIYHPSEVPEWICDDGTSIAVECGCPSPSSPGAPSPVASPTAQPGVSPTSQDLPAPNTAGPVSTPAPSLVTGEEPEPIPNTCPGDGTFTVTANAGPGLDGCFTGSWIDDASTVYTASGSTSQSEIVIFSLQNENGDFNWYIAYLATIEDSSEESQLYCVSTEQASVVNPGDASWICDFTGGSSFLAATEDDISVACGSCTSTVPTSQPAASPASPPTTAPVSLPSSATPQPAASSIPRVLPSPVPSTASPTASSTSPQTTLTPVVTPMAQPTTETEPTAAPSSASTEVSFSSPDTCSGDGSFTIAANAAPDLDGCFEDADTTDIDGSLVYTVSGTTTTDEVAVFSFTADDGNFNWYIGEDSPDGLQVYCVSEEQANDVNPGNASWSCDFTGESEIFRTTSAEDISIVCGTCTTAPTGEADSSPASQLGVGSATVGVAAVASAFAGWCYS